MRTFFKISISIFLLISCCEAFAQSNTAVISGSINDTDGPIAYVNIVTLTEDSVYIDGTVTDENGLFSFDAIPYGNKILKISYVGYETKVLNINVNSKQHNVGQIILNNNALQLNEVTITATKPLFQIKNGALITDVTNSLLSTLGTATDVLDKIPGVSTEDSKINVFGKGAPIIYLNNRKIYDNAELEQLTSNDIQTIEVIRNPGAKYDAENKAVIIIRTKRKSTGLSVNTFDRLRIGKYLSNRSMINALYEHDKINFFMAYNNSYFKSRTKEESIYTINADTTWTQIISIPYLNRDMQHDISGSMEWNISKNHAIGVQYKGTFTKTRNELIGEESIFANDIYLENIKSESYKKDSPKTHLVNAFYNGTLNNKFNYQLNLDYIDKKANSTQFTQETSSIPINNRILNINSHSDFKLIATKLITGYSISDKSNIEFGVEYNTIKGKGYYRNEENYLNNNIYTNDEDKFAAFMSYQTNIDDYSIGIGLRYEHSEEKSTEDSIKIVRVNQKYDNLYPNLSISKSFGNVNLSLNANRRTRRPSFSELNDNDLYVNRFITQKGNPYLKKEDYYEVDFGLYYKLFTFNLGYRYINNPINIEFEETSNSSSNSILTYKNYDKYQSLNIMGTFNYSLDFWKPQITMGYIQPFFTTIYDGKEKKRNKGGLSIDITNDFVLPKDFIASLYYTYESDNDSYITRYKNYNQIDIRLRKSFFNKSLITTLFFNDIFKLKKEGNHSYISNYDFRIKRERETRYISISIQYLFNRTSKKYRGGTATDDINRL